MINTILDLLLNLIFFILGLIIKLIMAVFPKFTLADQMATVIDSFFGLIGNASAMTYFLIGELTPTLVSFALVLFATRHVVLPVINFTRKALVR